MNIYYAIIAAGGKAKRFLPYSLVMPKELLPIDGVPAIQYSIEECIGAGINRIIIVTRPGNDLIYQYLLKNEKYSQYLVDTFCDQEQTQILILPEDRNLPYGNAAPLLTAKDIIIGNKFLVLFADDIILGENALRELISFSESHTEGHTIVGYQNVPLSEVHNYGNLEINEDNEIVNLRQKPTDNIFSNKVIVSRLLLDDTIFRYIEKRNDHELDLGLAIASQLQREAHSVFGCYLSGLWLCIDTPEKYLRAQNKHKDYVTGE